MMINMNSLKDKHRKIRDNWVSENSRMTNIKVHRAISWLNAGTESKDDDMKFISLWIAFNALYGKDSSMDEFYSTEKSSFKLFFKKIESYDAQHLISSKIWDHYSSLFRFFIDNKYVFAPFWHYQNNRIPEYEWLEKFKRGIHLSKKALGNQDSAMFLGLLFDRLYVLRNQLMHGNATYDSSINREQLNWGVNILTDIVPILIEILMDNPDVDWGIPAYLPIDS